MQSLNQMGRRLLPHGEFARHFMIVLSGGVAARALILIAMPVIARLYGPGEIGVWQLFVSLLVILPAVVSWRYEVAIVLPNEEHRASNLFWVCVWSSVLMSLLWTVPAVIFAEPIARLMGDLRLSGILWLVPVLALAYGLEQACAFWLTRRKAFKILAPSRILRSLAIVSIPITAAILSRGDVFHLIAGTAIGQLLVAATLMAYVLCHDRAVLWNGLRWPKILQAAAQYRNYPLFVAPYGVIAQFSTRLLYILLAIHASSYVVGQFAMAMQLTFIPILFISTALNQVFYPKMARELKGGSLQPFVLRVLSLMIIGAAPLFVLLGCFASDILAVVLGNGWREAGPFAAYLAAPAFLMLLTSWLNKVFDVTGRQRLSVALQTGYNVCSVALFVAFLEWGSPRSAVGAYCVATVAYNALWLMIAFRIAGFSLRGLLSPLASLLFLGTAAWALCIICSANLPPFYSLGAAMILTLILQIVVAFHWTRRNQMRPSTSGWEKFWDSQSAPLHARDTEEFYASYARELSLLFDNARGARVLEIGCGDGALYEHLGFHHAKQYRGVDLSSVMIAKFEKKRPEVSLAVHEGQSYEDDQQYDLIFSSGVVQYFRLSMLDEHLRRARNMLASDGRLVHAAIPWKSARASFRWGYLMGHRGPGLLRFVKATMKQVFAGRIGRWYNERELAGLARKHGLTVKFHGSLQYPYRLHAVFQKETAANSHSAVRQAA